MKLAQYLEDGAVRQVFTLSDKIDAFIGGYFVDRLLTGQIDSSMAAAKRARQLAHDPSIGEYLYWSPMEQTSFAIDAGMLLGSQEVAPSGSSVPPKEMRRVTYLAG